MKFKTLVALAVGGYAAWQWTARSQAGASRGDLADGRKPPPEHTWENEGGALPVTGSHIGPEPTLP